MYLKNRGYIQIAKKKIFKSNFDHKCYKKRKCVNKLKSQTFFKIFFTNLKTLGIFIKKMNVSTF